MGGSSGHCAECRVAVLVISLLPSTTIQMHLSLCWVQGSCTCYLLAYCRQPPYKCICHCAECRAAVLVISLLSSTTTHKCTCHCDECRAAVQVISLVSSTIIQIHLSLYWVQGSCTYYYLTAINQDTNAFVIVLGAGQLYLLLSYCHQPPYKCICHCVECRIAVLVFSLLPSNAFVIVLSAGQLYFLLYFYHQPPYKKNGAARMQLVFSVWSCKWKPSLKKCHMVFFHDHWWINGDFRLILSLWKLSEAILRSRKGFVILHWTVLFALW